VGASSMAAFNSPLSFSLHLFPWPPRNLAWSLLTKNKPRRVRGQWPADCLVAGCQGEHGGKARARRVRSELVPCGAPCLGI